MGRSIIWSTQMPVVPIGNMVRNAALDSVVTLTAPAGANWLYLSVETQAVRLRFDGSDPTADVGLLYPAGHVYAIAVVPGQIIKALENAASAVINYQWSK